MINANGPVVDISPFATKIEIRKYKINHNVYTSYATSEMDG